ncbi:MAG TPA: CBS domain-containing protein, partial [Planctomycetota bacterium]|nr:CBS domain-containing protein [Planctomycetota bacterium]
QVRDWMAPGMVLVPSDTPLIEALRCMNSKGIPRLGVLRAGQVWGVVTRIELYEQLEGTASGLLCRRSLADLLPATVSSLSPDDPLDRAAQLLFETGRPALPVLEGSAAAGVITPMDICRAFRHIFGVRSQDSPAIMLLNAPREVDLLDQIRQRTDGSAIQSLLAYPSSGREWQVMIRLGPVAPKMEKCA